MTVRKMNFIRRLNSGINILFTRHLFMTNVVTSSTMLGLGDYIVQEMTMIISKEQQEYDHPRTGRMIFFGLFFGPFNYFWYTFLDKAIQGQSRISVMKKIVLDQLIAATVLDSSFIVGLSILEEKKAEDIEKEWKEKFLKIYVGDWAFWPLAQYVNFRLVPGKFRVLYVSIATLFWNCFLSYVKHDEKVSKIYQGLIYITSIEARELMESILNEELVSFRWSN